MLDLGHVHKCGDRDGWTLIDETQKALRRLVIAGCDTPGVFQLVEATLDQIAQGDRVTGPRRHASCGTVATGLRAARFAAPRSLLCCQHHSHDSPATRSAGADNACRFGGGARS